MKGHIITRASLFFAIVILAALLVGCSGSGSTNAPSSAFPEVAAPATAADSGGAALLMRYTEGFWPDPILSWE